MPSPFPGVDPYVEAQGRSEGFRLGLVTHCRDALNKTLSEEYVAGLDARRGRIHLSDIELNLIGWDHPPGRVELEVRDVWIEIWRLPQRTAFALVEVLSPINKIGEGFHE